MIDKRRKFHDDDERRPDAGGISDEQTMRENLRMNCIPETMLDGEIKDFNVFLEERRKLMALKMKVWFWTFLKRLKNLSNLWEAPLSDIRDIPLLETKRNIIFSRFLRRMNTTKSYCL